MGSRGSNILLLGLLMILSIVMGSVTVTEPSTLGMDTRINPERIDDEFVNDLDADAIPFGGFIQNQGQVSDSATEFYLSADSTSIRFCTSEIRFCDFDSGVSFTMGFLNSELVAPVGQTKNSHVVNYFYGDLQIVNVPTWNDIWYYDLYPGIDLKYYVTEQGLKYDFVVHPGASPDLIQISMSDPLSVSVEAHRVSGQLISNREDSIYKDLGLKVFQEDGSKVFASYIEGDGTNTFRFQIDDYDTTQTLVIDPLSIVFSTYLGGFHLDYVRDIAIDSLGNSYLVGHTYSSDFPLSGPYDDTFNGSRDIFVTKINSTGNGLIYSTYIGGTDSDYGETVDLDSAFNVYIGGNTYSTDYPLQNEFDDTLTGTYKGIVTKLNSTGNGLEFSTYLGGESYDLLYGITVDDQNMTYVTGFTYSSDFPTKNAYDDSRAGSACDAFVTKLNESGNGLVFSTFIGGWDLDHGRDVAVDGDYNVYICGYANPGYPMVGAFQSSHRGGNYDGIISKLNSTGNGLLFSTYIGGNSEDRLRSIALDSEGNVYVTGDTDSSNYPILNQYQGNQVDTDVIVTKLSSSGNSLEFSTYVGGGAEDSAFDLTLDSHDNVYVTGYTESSDFPVIRSYEDEYGGNRDSFVFGLNASGSSLRYSTYLSGSQTDEGRGVAISDDEFLYVTGFTNSDDFPVQDALQGSLDGNYDTFLTKLWIDTGYRDPIVILSDLDFENQAAEHGWPGDGSIDTPYVIRGITIDCNGTANNSIYIEDTTVHFIITNCTFLDTTLSGVVLSNVVNGVIVNNTFIITANGISLMSSSNFNHVINNTFSDGTGWGITIADSSDNYIEDNAIMKHGGGVSLDSSHRNSVKNNNCTDPVGTGIQLVSSNNNTIVRNTCTLADRGISIAAYSSINEVEYNHITNCGTGIRLYSDYVIDNYVASNIVNDNVDGIYVRECVSNIIHNNTCNGNSYYGIELEFALDNTLSNNTCNYNEGTGIFVTRGDGASEDGDNIVENNTCSYNDYYGISVARSSSNIITYNTMAYNGVNGLRFTSDPCHSNTVRWNTFLFNSGDNVYDAITGGLYRYNYYSDYSGSDNNGDGIGDTAYEIEEFHTYDSYPLMISINWPYLDTLSPYWNEIPSDYYSCSGSVLYYLDAFDVFGLNTWWLDSALNFDIDNEGILVNSTILSDGTYPLTVYVNDSNGNIASSYFSIIVDTTAPTIDAPVDIIFEIGTGPHQILWTPDDDNPDSYELYIDDTLSDSDIWAGGTISLDVEDFTYGTHNVTLVIFDVCGRSITDTVFVHAIDSTLPEVTCWHSPLDPTEDVNVTITSSVVDATDVVEVVLSYSIGSPTTWANTTMMVLGENWIFTLPTYPEGTVIFYKCYALDTGGNWGVSAVYNVTIIIVPTTTTTTTSSTTTSTTTSSTSTSTSESTSTTTTSASTTSTTTTSATTSPTTPPLDGEFPVLTLIIGGGAFAVVLVIVIVAVRKQRTT
ncbi:MAG: SBBP repeat-containing protein [Candidatus Thorarchaeota archaeon]